MDVTGGDITRNQRWGNDFLPEPPKTGPAATANEVVLGIERTDATFPQPARLS
ncbi:MAG: hypothetical protein PVG64_04180 [Syntrophobacterales bacterium]